MLTEICQMEKDNYCMICSYVESKKKTSEQNKLNTKTNSLIKHIDVTKGEGVWRVGTMGEEVNYMVMNGDQTFGGDHSLVYTDVKL